MNKLTSRIFHVEDSKTYVGFTNGETWNGWDKVFVTANELELFRKEFADAFDDWDSLPKINTKSGKILTYLSGFCTEIYR